MRLNFIIFIMAIDRVSAKERDHLHQRANFIHGEIEKSKMKHLYL